MKCPVDGAELLMAERQGVEIDYCPQCRGVWLDRGELDKIIEKATPVVELDDPDPFISSEEPASISARPRRSGADESRDRSDKAHRDRDRYEDRDDKRHGKRDRSDKHSKRDKSGRKKKRKSFLKEIFDVFD